MDSSTLTALQASIAHWEENARAESVDDASTSPDDCDLCLVFYDGGCEGCPISQKTGFEGCLGSPYDAAADALDIWLEDESDPELKANFHRAAQEMLAFLKDLVPCITDSKLLATIRLALTDASRVVAIVEPTGACRKGVALLKETLPVAFQSLEILENLESTHEPRSLGCSEGIHRTLGREHPG